MPGPDQPFGANSPQLHVESLNVRELVRLACGALELTDRRLAAVVGVTRKAAQVYLAHPELMPREQRDFLVRAMAVQLSRQPDPFVERIMLALRNSTIMFVRHREEQRVPPALAARLGRLASAI